MHVNGLQLERTKLQISGTTKHQVAFYEAQVSKLRAEVSSIKCMYVCCDIIYWEMYIWVTKISGAKD